MPIQISCPACGRALRVPDSLIGEAVKCPSCLHQFVGAASPAPPPLPPRPEEAFRPLEERADHDQSQTQPSQIREDVAPRRTLPPPLPRFDDYDDDDADFDDRRSRGRGRYREDIIQRVSGPANGVLAVGIIGLVLAGPGIFLNLMNAGNGRADAGVAVAAVGSGVFHIAISIVIIIGAQKMKRLESHSFAKTAAILSAIPCISPCCLLGLIFGIQANNVLNDPEVREAFTS